MDRAAKSVLEATLWGLRKPATNFRMDSATQREHMIISGMMKLLPILAEFMSSGMSHEQIINLLTGKESDELVAAAISSVSDLRGELLNQFPSHQRGTLDKALQACAARVHSRGEDSRGDGIAPPRASQLLHDIASVLHPS